MKVPKSLTRQLYALKMCREAWNRLQLEKLTKSINRDRHLVRDK